MQFIVICYRGHRAGVAIDTWRCLLTCMLDDAMAPSMSAEWQTAKSKAFSTCLEAVQLIDHLPFLSKSPATVLRFSYCLAMSFTPSTVTDLAQFLAELTAALRGCFASNSLSVAEVGGLYLGLYETSY